MSWKKMGLVRTEVYRFGFVKIRFYRDGNRRWRWDINLPRWLRIKRL